MSKNEYSVCDECGEFLKSSSKMWHYARNVLIFCMDIQIVLIFSDIRSWLDCQKTQQSKKVYMIFVQK